MAKKKNIKVYFYFSFFLVILDQVSKIGIKGFSCLGINYRGMEIGSSIKIWGNFLHITYVENAGMAFGIEFGVGKIFLSLFSIVASIGLVYYLYKISKYSAIVKTGIAFILAGAVGNLIDRVFYGVLYGDSAIFYGRVVDFIHVNITNINIFGLNYTLWPVFNIADACVTIGIIILLIFHKKIPTLQKVLKKK